jgi:hypothetical protein
MVDAAEAFEEVDDGYNHEYEVMEQQKVVWVSDGHFIDQSWVSLGEAEPVQPLYTDKVFLLSTCLRHPEGEELAGESYAHERHPFVVFLHLLAKAEANSTVYISMPYLSDFDAIDQLCHYADPQNGGLIINIVLGPRATNISNLENFVGRSQTREEAVARLRIKQFGWDDRPDTTSFSHSKAMVSTAGGMVGSYNYSVASRKRHHETGTFIPPTFEDVNGLEAEMEMLWNSMSAKPEISIERQSSPARYAAPQGSSVLNPYSRKRPKQK